MSNWIDSGGHEPRQFSDAYADKKYPLHRIGQRKVPLRLACAALLVTLAAQASHARDPDGRYAAQNPELHKWFESLRSGKGPCCSDADGTAVSDVDWETANGHYRVRLDGEWIEVPDEAVITEPIESAAPWSGQFTGYLGVSIRCFMPGSMT